jgi:hypothetical protein
MLQFAVDRYLPVTNILLKFLYFRELSGFSDLVWRIFVAYPHCMWYFISADWEGASTAGDLPDVHAA